MYQPPPDLWPPQRRGLEQTIAAIIAGKHACLYAPTGGGKTRIAQELFHWCLSNGWCGAFFLNRKLLLGQTAARFAEARLPYAIRAADYEDAENFSAPVQICSTGTEWSRVYERKIWKPLDAQLVVIDEVHLQSAATMTRIVEDYKSRGAIIVGMTATPIGVSHLFDELIVSGTLAEYRACKALVPAVVRSIEQPDMSKVVRNKTGEFVWKGEKRRIYTQTIVGNVIERWKRYNPDARPTLLYAPGVAESVWFTEQFREQGVNWCHVDATDAVVDGVRAKLTRPLWDEIKERYVSGDIKGISSRFKLREGIDFPDTYHCILATPIGSMASYIQCVGRTLRHSAKTPDNVLITDHGGCYLRLGSPNIDRPWKDWWNLSESAISRMPMERIRNGEAPEPIRCPQCEGERIGGMKCPHCGFVHEKSRRRVIMADGRMRIREGRLIRKKYVTEHPDTQKKWNNFFYGYRKRGRRQTFAQMEAYFVRVHGYYPPRTLVNMPKYDEDWHARVGDVPYDRLITSADKQREMEFSERV